MHTPLCKNKTRNITTQQKVQKDIMSEKDEMEMVSNEDIDMESECIEAWVTMGCSYR